jgi:aminoglycoside 6-adenylyltransferase
MRSEQEMLDLIIDTAKSDARIRAVTMNGSRANPNASRDFFQDFDVVYFVTDIAPYIENPEWIRRFGELMILQIPEDMQEPPPAKDGGFGYLMQFSDGNRIDLGVYPTSKLNELTRDSLTMVLLDKDGAIERPPSSEQDYLPAPPTAKQFADCCNEFWWVSAYVAKGLWRHEIIYALSTYEHYVREQLLRILRWHIGMRTGFAVNPGKMGKYYQRYLEPELWEALLKTYSDAELEHIWQALFATCELFRTIALQIAEHFGFPYNQTEDRNMTAHLHHVHDLPGDAREMY